MAEFGQITVENAIDKLIQKDSNYMQSTAQKATPQNNVVAINTLKKAQQAVDNLSSFFGYNRIKSVRELQNENYKKTSERTKNALYEGEGVAGILNIGIQDGKQKTNQEDSILALSHPQNSNFRIALVADGMGGQGNGSAASHIATILTKEWFENLPKDFYSNDNILLKHQDGRNINISFEEAIKHHLINVNGKIKRLLGDSPGTTFSAAITRNKNGLNSITAISIGDSKILKISPNGQVKQLSKDDNILSKAIEEGAIYVEPNNPNDIYTSDYKYIDRATYKPIQESSNPKILKAADVRFYKRNNVITDFVGCGQDNREFKRKLDQKTKEFISEHPFNKGDKLFLCSDGISDTLTNEEISKFVYTYKNSSECLKHIINEIYEKENQKQKQGHNNPPNYLRKNVEFKGTLKGSRR